MQAPTPSKPLRIILETSIPQLHELVAPLLSWLTPRDHPTRDSPPTPAEEEEQDADPLPERTADPPHVATSVQAAQSVAPDRDGLAVLPAGTVLGPLCKRQHHHDGLPLTLRSQRTGKCVTCCRMTPDEKQHFQLPVPVRKLAPLTQGADRPALPRHIDATCFLSPIPCSDPSHRYRGSAFTLRFKDSEQCVQCTTQTHQLAGD
jgi:hypothetical protein